MKNRSDTHGTSRHLFTLVLAASLALPLPALADSVTLASTPLQTAAASTVMPNVMFMLDDSGSMDWDYMPDDSKNFSGKYGFNTNSCNGVYYNPAITYTPPVTSTGANLTTPSSDSNGNQPFTNAEKSGYKTGTTVNLNTGFTGGSGSGSSGISLTPGPAFYYTYSGSQTANWQKDFHNTNSVFYKECISSVGSTTAYDTSTDIAANGPNGTNTNGPHPVNTVFKKTVLGSTETSYITVNTSTANATFTITVGGLIPLTTPVTSIKVGGTTITSGSASGGSTLSTEASSIANKITSNGYSATVSNAVITVTGPASVGSSVVVTTSSGTDTFAVSAISPIATISSIKVNGTELLLSGSAALDSSTSTTATNIKANINATGYTAAVSGNVVTITGPSSAANYTPVITYSGTLTYTVTQFPDTDSAHLKNFANWYSYYSNRMMMMKTGVGQAFSPIDAKYRVGFMTMNNNVSPDIVEISPFDAAQRSAWYTKLYASTPGNSTPLREALSHVGQLYTHKFGDYDIYTATVTVGGSGSTSVSSVAVMESGATVAVETMAGTSAADTNTTNVAANIAAQINLLDPSNYGASSKNNVVTITGPVTALGAAPGITNNGGGMTFTKTTFTKTTIHAQLNGITPADPVQYSCQQNFVILSTDGYWNGATDYDLSTPNKPVGNQDGTAPRPMYDGGLFTKTTSQTTQYKTHWTEKDTQLQQRTVQQQKQTSQLKQDVGTLQYQTSTLQTLAGTLQGTLSKVLMQCNNTAATCGKAPASGVAGGGWAVVTSGTCTLAASVQCSVVSGLSGSTNAATKCDTSASITSSGVTYAQFTIKVSGVSANTTFSSIKIDGVQILTATTSQSNSNNGVASAIKANVGNGYSASVSSNVVTITNNGTITSASTITASTLGKGAAALAGAVIGTNSGIYTLNNADSNGKIYSACTYNWGSWTNAVAACSVNKSSSNPYTVTAANDCQYAKPGTSTAGWSNWTSGACTAAAQDNTNLTAEQCQYTWTNAQGTPSCSTPAYVAGNYSNTTVYQNCTTAITSAYTNAACGPGDVTTVPDASGYTSQCQAFYNGQTTPNVDNGWVGTASCTNSGPTNGLTVYCNNPNLAVVVNNMNVQPVLSCTVQNPLSTNNYVSIGCTTNHDPGDNTVVGSCTQGNSGSPNYIQTTCTTKTLTTVNNATSCVPGNSGPPSYIQTTCTGGAGGTADTLADVAMYYYQTDIRDASLANCNGAASTDFPSGNPDVCTDDVPETQTSQHMTTYTLGLGARGRMVYESKDYMNDQKGDFYSVYDPKFLGIKADSTQTPPICSWQADGTICNWPIPASGSINNIDDLWHAAVNGRGTYYSAKDPAELSDGLTSALTSITAKKGSAAAAATSTLNPVAGNNFAYVASYTTLKWIGNLEARSIDTTSGVISQNASWCVENIPADTCASPGTVVTNVSGSSTTYNCVTPNATVASCPYPNVFDAVANTCSVQMTLACSGKLPTMVGATSDSRIIKTADSTGKLVDFNYSNLTATQQAYFGDPYISGLSQWVTLTASQQAAAAGANLVNYLRGQKGYENSSSNPVSNRLYRARDAVLGDALESQPSFIAAPTFSYADAGYSAFALAQASRPGTVYMGTNDGMLHAFYAQDSNPPTPPAKCIVGAVAGQHCGGEERWAFIPTQVIPNLWHLADTGYDIHHANFVNGSPIISDYYCTQDCGSPGGAPQWRTVLVGGLNAGGREYYALDITDPTAPTLMWEFTPAKDANLGYTFGLPVVTKMADGTWVILITSGYDNGTGSATPITPATLPPTFVPNSPGGDGKGYLYVLNARTGAIIKKIGNSTGSATTPSGLAKIASLNTSSDSNVAGYTYGGDLQGNVWRFDINAAASPGANPLRFAILKDSSGATQPITATPILGDVKSHSVVFVGTGKYLEQSDNTSTQTQTLYAIKDDSAIATLVNPRSYTATAPKMVQQTITPISGTGVREGSYNPVNFDSDRGWFVDFPESEERVNIDGKLLLGTLLVPTIVPTSTFCSPGGHGWLNYFNYENGWPTTDGTGQGSAGTNKNVSTKFDASIVGLNILFIAGKPVVEVVTSNNPTPTIPTTPPVFNAGNSNFTGKRMQWRELIP